MKRLFFITVWMIAGAVQGHAQLYYKGTLKANREKTYGNLVRNTINKNLENPLTAATTVDWEGAFNAMEVLRYHNPWINGRIDSAVTYMHQLPLGFQRATLELLHANYPGKYYTAVKLLLMQTNDPKIFAMCAVYILTTDHASTDISFLQVKTQQLRETYPNNAILHQLQNQLLQYNKPFIKPAIELLLAKNYLPGQVVVFSFQRKNRNYPGLVMVRDVNGNFIADSNSNYFAVPQLARSITNLPGYLSNGNTPEGIYRMYSYDVSRSNFIGPTVNVQLTMPFERNAAHFYNDPSLKDTTWDISYYKKLLPGQLKEHAALYGSYYAGKAGRTEIIIHGTTVDPLYYSGQPYFPLTPTMGCLTSKEIWNEENGQRQESDQQLLINALIKAGGAKGYTIVINIDDEERPVLLHDIVPFIEKARKN